eukprot:CAMPEP_0170221564 /NCGR_PEP_ID=MMETSP0116_2-20130129/10471_1 /TAXON_ID=400756 /ORGANISM="Durinskia baltica, Strain CSIRO CS-38" /LENGTH=651 /DNA_ID=CAMNT_0010472245 /DNA_START=85 /DNA_END=2041 /DNA_ORIENTATION=+
MQPSWTMPARSGNAASRVRIVFIVEAQPMNGGDIFLMHDGDWHQGWKMRMDTNDGQVRYRMEMFIPTSKTWFEYKFQCRDHGMRWWEEGETRRVEVARLYYRQKFIAQPRWQSEPAEPGMPQHDPQVATTAAKVEVLENVATETDTRLDKSLQDTNNANMRSDLTVISEKPSTLESYTMARIELLSEQVKELSKDALAQRVVAQKLSDKQATAFKHLETMRSQLTEFQRHAESASQRQDEHNQSMAADVESLKRRTCRLDTPLANSEDFVELRAGIRSDMDALHQVTKDLRTEFEFLRQSTSAKIDPLQGDLRRLDTLAADLDREVVALKGDVAGKVIATKAHEDLKLAFGEQLGTLRKDLGEEFHALEVKVSAETSELKLCMADKASEFNVKAQVFELERSYTETAGRLQSEFADKIDALSGGMIGSIQENISRLMGNCAAAWKQTMQNELEAGFSKTYNTVQQDIDAKVGEVRTALFGKFESMQGEFALQKQRVDKWVPKVSRQMDDLQYLEMRVGEVERELKEFALKATERHEATVGKELAYPCGSPKSRQPLETSPSGVALEEDHRAPRQAGDWPEDAIIQPAEETNDEFQATLEGYTIHSDEALDVVQGYGREAASWATRALLDAGAVTDQRPQCRLSYDQALLTV